jgi:hypothetical protein
MNLLNNAIIGGNLTVNRGADFTGPVNVLAKGATAVGDLTNAALVVTGSNSDGTQGITVNSFAPTVSFIDRDADAAGFRLRGEGSSLRLDVDSRNNGVTWNQNIALFSDKGHLALGGGSDSTGRMLTLGNTAPGKGNLTGATQIAAMAYTNIGADATTRGIGFGVEMSVGDGSTGQNVPEVVEFWSNSTVVNANATVGLMSSFRVFDKANLSIKSAFAFEGMMTQRAGLNRWNLYMQGTAPNYLRGQTIIGGVDTATPASYIALSVKGGLEVSDILRASNAAEFRGQVSLISANPYIDFNSSTAKLNDYDARILVDATDAAVTGQATMNIVAGRLNISAASHLTGTLTVDQDAHFNNGAYVTGPFWASNHINIGSVGTAAFAGSAASINIGDSDTGLVCPSDGVLDFYSNNVITARLTANKLYVYGKIVTEDPDFRIRPTGGKGVGMLHRFDGSSYYMLVTNQNDPDGAFNTLRPFSFNSTNGDVLMSHNVNVGGNFSANGTINAGGNLFAGNVVYSGNGQSVMHADGNIYGPVWGGFINNYMAARFVTAVRFAGFKQASTWNGPGMSEEGGYVITSARNDNQDQYIDIVTARCVQYCINGVWYTAGFA